MNTLLAFTDLIIEYWYISAMLLLAVVAILIAVGVLIARAVKQIKEDNQVTKARKKDSEEKKAVKKEEEKIEVKNKETLPPEEVEDTTEAVVETTEVVETEGEKADGNVEKREIKAVYRVIYDKENKEWMVKKDGAQRVIRRVKTKAEALELANQFATNQDLSISVQKKDGKFQKKRNYKAMMNSDKGDK